ncbi:hypothetical protein [Nocardioides coralli]|uniref:hypothetical protein n=1 Tax=Nocardioides coralli TaxID=2872154 RepID=UPI001CA3F68E|nr:hypothetical protein [Nocardioides coralli]QZY29188.1 hypothetical protein K6T13_00175 [Nocardioides coralli]
MSDQDPDVSSTRTQDGAWRRYGPVVLPALTFLIGIALGAGAVLALDTGADPVAEPDDSSSSPAGPEDSGGDTVVTVPGACERAAETLQEATRLLDDVAVSLRDFRPRELVDLLNQLEELDRETRELASQCSEDVEITEEPSPTS